MKDSLWRKIEKTYDENVLLADKGMPKRLAPLLLFVGLKFWMIGLIISGGLALLTVYGGKSWMEELVMRGLWL
jgi:hypothetical protein